MKDPNGVPSWLSMLALQLIRGMAAIALTTPFMVLGVMVWKLTGH